MKSGLNSNPIYRDVVIDYRQRIKGGVIYRRGKNRTTPRVRLNKNISTHINLTLKGNKYGRHWEDLVGYSGEELRQHLEGLFTEGMNWDNYGKWHVDHKIPKSVFNFTKPEHEDFKRCWALSNLQPMWAIENISKGAKLKKPFQPSLLL